MILMAKDLQERIDKLHEYLERRKKAKDATKSTAAELDEVK